MYFNYPLGSADRLRSYESKIIQFDSVPRERVGHVVHFFIVTEADAIAEVVRYYSEMISMVANISWQICPVAPADNALLADARSFPVNFQFQLI
jgi:hypothetical protein